MTILTPALSLGHLLVSVVLTIVAGAFNVYAAHNLARTVRESLEPNPNV